MRHVEASAVNSCHSDLTLQPHTHLLLKVHRATITHTAIYHSLKVAMLGAVGLVSTQICREMGYQ